MKHTPGPWSVERTELVGTLIRNENGFALAEMRFIGEYFTEANAKRIVSCVNACEGMEDPKVEIERMKWQINHLKSFAHELATIAEQHIEGYYGEEAERIRKIREFINNLK